MSLGIQEYFDFGTIKIGKLEIRINTLFMIIVLMFIGYYISDRIISYNFASIFLMIAVFSGIFALVCPERIMHLLVIIVIFPSFMQLFIDLPYLWNEFNILYGMILIGFLIKATTAKSIRFSKPYLSIPIILYCLVLSIGAFHSLYSDDFVALYPFNKITIISAGCIKPILFISLYFVGVLFLRDKRATSFLISISVGLVVLLISAISERFGMTFKYSFYNPFGAVPGRWGGGFITNPTNSSVVLAVYSVIIFIYAIESRVLNKSIKRYFILIFILPLFILVFLGSRTVLAFLPIILGLYSLKYNRKYLLFTVAIGVILYIFMPGSIKDRFIYDRYDQHGVVEFSSGRSIIWENVIESVSDSRNKLIFGDGWESFRYKTRLSVSTHNMLLDHLAFYGLIGIAALLFLIFRIMKLIFIQINQPLGKALLFAFILYLLHNLFHTVHLAGNEMAPFFLFLGLLENGGSKSITS